MGYKNLEGKLFKIFIDCKLNKVELCLWNN